MSDIQEVTLLDPKTKEVKHTFPSIWQAQKVLGIGASAFYRRLNKPMDRTLKVQLRSSLTYHGEWIVRVGAAVPKALIPADPEAEYIVELDGTTYAKGTLAQCKAVRDQLRNPNVKMTLWQKQQQAG